MRRWTGGLIILLLLALPGVAAADDASLGRMGEAVQPVHNTQVRMIEEEVNIRVYRYKCEVTATFLFRNDGPATTVLVGVCLCLQALNIVNIGDGSNYSPDALRR